MNGIVALVVILSLLTHVIDQALDIFVAFLYYLEGRYLPSSFALAFVFLPGLYIFILELRKCCQGQSNLLKAFAYLLFSPLWAIVIHCYSLFDKDYVRTAFFFKAIEGFMEAGPQLTLQLSLYLRGNWTSSGQVALQPIIPNDGVDAVQMQPLEFHGRDYDPERLGHVHLASVLFSFFSVLVSAVSFNDLEDRYIVNNQDCCSKGAWARISVSLPFFFCTLSFRALGLGLLICFLRFWSGVIIFALFFINFLSAVAIGDQFQRSFSYALWSLLVPIGFNRDPEVPLGYKKVNLFSSTVQLQEDPGLTTTVRPMTEKEAEMSRVRAKYFLTAHLVSSILILGFSLLFTLIWVQISPDRFGGLSAFPFDLQLLNLVFLPVLGLTLGLSVFFARPYHRCDCSGGEAPKGNILL